MHAWAASFSKGQFSVGLHSDSEAAQQGWALWSCSVPSYPFTGFLPLPSLPYVPHVLPEIHSQKNLLAPKFSPEGLCLREPQLNQTLASEMQGSGHKWVPPIIDDPLWRKKWGRREAIYSKSRAQFRNKVERQSLKVGFILKPSMGSHLQNSSLCSRHF